MARSTIVDANLQRCTSGRHRNYGNAPPPSSSDAGSAANPADDQPLHIPCLDGLRGLAALMVMAFHFFSRRGSPELVGRLAVFGQTGVDLFFVLSGFLITRILLQSRGREHFFRAFYMRRALRIFPLYFGFLALFFYLLPAMSGTAVPPWQEQIWSWLYLQNIPQTFSSIKSAGPSHFWSLAVEEHFYLAWPLIVYFLPTNKLAKVLLVIVLVCPLLRFILEINGIGSFYLTPARIDSIAFGALLAVLPEYDARLFGVLVINFKWAFSALALILIPWFLLLSGTSHALMQAAKLTLIPAFYCALVGYCIFDKSSTMLTGWLSASPLRWIGSISYGLYVFHPAVLALVRDYLWQSSLVINSLLYFLLTVIVASLSFRYFETPFLKLKNHFQ